ncbi:MAG: trimethylamine methyltransferase, partial [Dehalococcoidia bacterium]|nr:trimethylamine methyltransferase [Dehalococcoidia bacterium]
MSPQRTGRRGSRRRQDQGPVVLEGVETLTYKLTPTEVLTEQDIQTIHDASMRLLSETGMLLIDHEPALKNLKANGAKVDGEMVWIDEDTLMNFVNLAPKTFTQLARDDRNNVPVGGNRIIFAPVYGPAFVHDLDQGRRPSTLEDFHNFAKLVCMTPELHHAGGVLVEPNDIDVNERHLDMLMAHLTLSNKAFMGNVIHPDNARDTVEMSEIIFGKEAIRENPASLSIVSISSPMRMDERMLSVLEVYAEAKQAMILAPFIIVGAMSPATLAAAIAQQNAESLFAIAYAQMLNPGTPCIQGPFLPNVDMKTGAPGFGSPESNLALYGSAQMARHYGLPFRSGG